MQLQRNYVLSVAFFLHLISNSQTKHSTNGTRSRTVLYPRGQSLFDCYPPNGGEGSCILISRCRRLWNSRDYELLRSSICGFEGEIPKVCCPHEVSRRITYHPGSFSSVSRRSTLTPRVSRRPLVATFVPPPETERKHIKTSSTTERQTITVMSESFRSTRPIQTTTDSPRFGKTQDEKSQNDPRPFLPKECGKNSVTFRRIVGGQESVIGAWPWMAAIFLRRRGIKSAECGGALVTSKHVLTAAHCMFNARRNVKLDPKTLSVRLGDHDLESDEDEAIPVNVNVKSLTIHNRFDIRTFQNDIALLELSSTVQFINHVGPICLPYGSVFEGDSLANRNAFAAGWGTLSFDGPVSSKLMEVQLRIWRNEDCEERFRKEAPITSVNLCAGDGDKDSCRGDSGGPLMWPFRDGKFYMIGIVSFGKKCAEPGYPGVYTRVTSFLDWIEEKIIATQ